MIGEVRTAIYTRVLTAAGLSATNVFWGEAPQGTTEDPYCVLSLVSNPVERDTEQEYEEIYFQVSFYGTTLTALETIEALVRTIFYNQLTPFNAILSTVEAKAIGLQFTTSLKIDENFWQNILRFKADIE